MGKASDGEWVKQRLTEAKRDRKKGKKGLRAVYIQMRGRSLVVI